MFQHHSQMPHSNMVSEATLHLCFWLQLTYKLCFSDTISFTLCGCAILKATRKVQGRVLQALAYMHIRHKDVNFAYSNLQLPVLPPCNLPQMPAKMN